LRTEKSGQFTKTILVRITRSVAAITTRRVVMSFAARGTDGASYRLPHPTRKALSADRGRLLALMQSINFGHIEGLDVRSGEPILDPLPRVVRELKFGGDNAPRSERDIQDFLLKSQVVELFKEFDRLVNGRVELLEVKHGLPFRMFIAGDPA
jgi:hypothetical protein